MLNSHSLNKNAPLNNFHTKIYLFCINDKLFTITCIVRMSIKYQNFLTFILDITQEILAPYTLLSKHVYIIIYYFSYTTKNRCHTLIYFLSTKKHNETYVLYVCSNLDILQAMIINLVHRYPTRNRCHLYFNIVTCLYYYILFHRYHTRNPCHTYSTVVCGGGLI